MKSEKASFFSAGLPAPQEIEVLIKDYVTMFFHSHDPNDSNSFYEGSLDMFNRYSLYLAEEAGYLSKEDIKVIRTADKENIDKYIKGRYQSSFSLINNELYDFFEWLTDILLR